VDLPYPGRETARSRMPRRRAAPSSRATDPAVPGVPCRYTTGRPPRSPTSTYSTSRPSAVRNTSTSRRYCRREPTGHQKAPEPGWQREVSSGSDRCRPTRQDRKGSRGPPTRASEHSRHTERSRYRRRATRDALALALRLGPESAGLPDIRLHDGRHTAASLLQSRPALGGQLDRRHVPQVAQVVRAPQSLDSSDTFARDNR
jgi:hypothetical protein